MPILFLTVLIDLIGFGMIIPILPFAAPAFGASELDIALLIVVYSVFGAICSPMWGRLSDRWSRKKTLLLCVAGGALCYVLLAFASSLWMLYAVRILAGCFSGNFGVASAYAADLSTPENRARAMGIVGAAFGLGMVVGPSLGGLLAGPQASLMLPSLVAAALSVIAIGFGSVMLREAPHTRTAQTLPALSLRALLVQTGNGTLVLQMLILTGAITTVSYLFPLAVGHHLGWGPREVGIVFGIQGVSMAAIQFGLIGRLTHRYGEMPLLRMALSLMIVGFLISALLPSQAGLLTGFFITVTGAACCPPVLNSLLSQRTPMPLRGRMLGTSSAASSGGRVLGPLAAGLALSLSGYTAAWLVGVVAGTFTLVWALRHRLDPADLTLPEPVDGR